MKNDYKIKYSSLFFDDLTKIISYIKHELKNSVAANNLVNEVEKSILERLDCPTAYEAYKSLKNRKNTYYRIYIKNYTIFYVVKDNIMEVRRILYSKRNFKDTI